MNNITFRKKLIVFIIVIGILPIMLLTSYLYISSSKEIKQEVISENTTFATLKHSRIEAFFMERKGDGNVLSQNKELYDVLEDASSQNNITANELLKSVATNYGYTNVLAINKNGKVVAADNKDFINKNLSSEDYIKEALSGNQNWSELSYNEELNDNIMSLATPIIYYDEVIGVTVLSINQSTIDSLIHESINLLGKSGDSYLVDNTGLLLTNTKLGDYTKDAALKHKVISKGTEKLMDALNENNTELKFTGIYKDYLNNNVLGSVQIIPFGDSYAGLVIELDEVEGLATVNTMRNIIIGAIVGTLLLIIGLSIFIVKKLLHQVKSVNNMLEDIAEGDGDLTKRMLVQTRDEFGKLSNLFNKFAEKIRGIISKVLDNVKSIAVSSNQISSAMEESNRSMELINSKVTSISDALQNNASIVEEANASIEELASSSTVVAGEASEVANAASEVLEAAKVGSENLDKVFNAIFEVKNSSDEIKSVVDKLDDSSEKIIAIIDIITNIAEQVDLLALNATIEAARAGEHGKGFAVVADEIRKLAEESRSSASNISGLVLEIKDATTLASTTVEKEQGHVEESVEKVKESEKEFSNILSRIENMTQMINNINDMVTNQSKITDDMASAMNEIATATISSADAIGDITGSIQNQSSIFQQITASVEELSARAYELKNETDKFKV